MTTFMSCSISSTVRPSSSRNGRISRVICRVSFGFIPAVGSSSSRSFGSRRQRAGDLQPSLIAVWQISAYSSSRPNGRQNRASRVRLARPRVSSVLNRRRAENRAEGPRHASARDAHQHILQRRSCWRTGECSGRCGPIPDLDDLVRSAARQILPREGEGPARRHVEAGDDVEERRLARTIRADQRDD